MSHIAGDTVSEIKTQAELRMQNAIEDLGRAMATIRTSRASIALLDPIKVNYYGTATPISQIATLAIPNSSLITIQPWDVSQIRAIEKAIMVSNLGLNPANDGKLIRLAIPPLTQERRKELVKQLHNVVEKHRVSVRNVRRDANDAIKHLEKDKTISEDESKRGHDDIQKITNHSIEQMDKAALIKENEIMEIG